MKSISPQQWKFDSKVGPLYLVASAKGLKGVYVERQNIEMVKSLKHSKILQDTVDELSEYFNGDRKKFDIPLDIEGTEFQKRVWNQLRKIPFGKTFSYKELATQIKNEKACRAVGTANGKNPLCIIIPCHRIIAADGTLGGYSGGLDLKIKLLELEGKSFAN
jgi:methylated-DNA-[protein]-cysteine S-methyltransferase